MVHRKNANPSQQGAKREKPVAKDTSTRLAKKYNKDPEEILGDSSNSNNYMRTLESILTETLKESDEQRREELRRLLKKWEMRILFVEALEEARENLTPEERKKYEEEMKQRKKENNNPKIFGHELSEKHYPILRKWAQRNPDTLEERLKSIANAWHEGNVVSAMQALESDLEHGG